MVMPNPIVVNPNSSGSPTRGGIQVIKSRHNKIILSVSAIKIILSVSAIIAISASTIAFGVVAVTMKENRHKLRR
jgi:hypothetical protein